MGIGTFGAGLRVFRVSNGSVSAEWIGSIVRRIWFPFYLDDYDSDTSHLTFEQHGAYLALLKQYYRTGGPIPANAEQLHRICRASTQREKAAIDTVLSYFFTMNEDA